MNTLLKYAILLFVALSAVFSSCKKCKDCAEYLYVDDSKGRPQYSKISAEFCKDDLDAKENARVISQSDTLRIIPQFECE